MHKEIFPFLKEAGSPVCAPPLLCLSSLASGDAASIKWVAKWKGTCISAFDIVYVVSEGMIYIKERMKTHWMALEKDKI